MLSILLETLTQCKSRIYWRKHKICLEFVRKPNPKSKMKIISLFYIIDYIIEITLPAFWLLFHSNVLYYTGKVFSVLMIFFDLILNEKVLISIFVAEFFWKLHYHVTIEAVISYKWIKNAARHFMRWFNHSQHFHKMFFPSLYTKLNGFE